MISFRQILRPGLKPGANRSHSFLLAHGFNHGRSWCLALLIAVTATACGGSGGLDINLDQPGFPSAGGAGPSGNDALSSSTNFSQKLFDPRSKADGLSGAAFVAPPQINNYGAVSFSYDIEVPPGRAGVQPQISLGYSSSGGDGWVGIGWNLGLGAISRTTQYGQLFYDQRDVFTYGGKRLVKVSGPTYNENGIYRLEIEDGSFSRLELTEIESGGVWTVFDKNGTKTVYGQDFSQRIYHPEDATKTYTWNFSKTVDINGNYMTASYDTSEFDDNRILYLKEIRYTGNENENFPARQYIRFHLQDRDDIAGIGEDTGLYVSKAAGFIMRMNKVLERIEVGFDDPEGSNNTELWNYELEYSLSADSNRPLLETVESSRTSTTPKFHYQPAVHQFTWQQVNNIFANDPEVNPQASQYFEGDFNGDGKSDMAFFNPENGKWKVVGSRFDGGYTFSTWADQFQGYSGQNKIQWFKGNVTGDYDGNGKSDIAFYLTETKTFMVAESQGDHFTFRNYGKFVFGNAGSGPGGAGAFTGIDIFKAEWFTGDYDGNGLSDIILFDEPTGSWILMTNDPSTGSGQAGFRFIKFGEYFRYVYRDDYAPSLNQNANSSNDLSGQGRDRGKLHWLSGDFNGDGRSDISLYDARSGKWWVITIGYRNQAPSCTAQNFVPEQCIEADLRLYREFTAPEQTLFSNDRFSGDYNGDGYTDFLLFDREEREWLLGETTTDFQGNGSISFRKFSNIPSSIDSEVTRWLQGDFNGDGRTDIGFYSRDDNNFWIGEATPNGFRYRIYNNLNFGGPHPDDVMRAPAPEEEVVIQQGQGFVATTDKTQQVEYEFDGNTTEGRGEIAITGCYTGNCTDAPQLLVIDRANRRIFLREYGNENDKSSIEDLDELTRDSFRMLNRQATSYAFAGQAEAAYYFQESNGEHNFRIVTFGNGTTLTTIAASFAENNHFNNFKLDESFYTLGRFGLGPGAQFLALDDQPASGDAKFKAIVNGSEVAFNIAGAATGGNEQGKLSFKNLFQLGSGDANRGNRSKFKFFHGNFTNNPGEPEQVLVVDMTGASHQWYLGSLLTGGTNSINFTRLTGTANLIIDNNTTFMPRQAAQRIEPLGQDVLVFTRVISGKVAFFQIKVEATTVSLVSHGSLPDDHVYSQYLNHQHKPIITYPGGLKILTFNNSTAGFQLTQVGSGDASYAKFKIARPDLYTKVYPFQWIQGDYNGDGKTDIGIFHLKESKWYYAMTQGTVPDLIEKVENGIGGFYNFTYANSSGFDNTGDDNISDLPINYKVCTELEVNDGQGQIVKNRYEYAGGFAFSSYIAGEGNGAGVNQGRKETDFYGFQTFITIDGLGSKTINTYNTTPFSDYLDNRALAGAIEESRFIGWDHKQYSRTTFEYQILKINTSYNGPAAKNGLTRSYWPFQSQQVKYIRGTKTETTNNNVVLDGYKVENQTTSVTDHYSDAARGEVTQTSFIEVELISLNNQQRVTTSVALQGTAYETTTSNVYDARGNLFRQTVSATGNGLDVVADRITERSYDGFGNLVAQQDVSASPARRTEFEYDSRLFQFNTVERLIGDLTNISQMLVINYGSAFGQAAEVIDANGNKSYFDYDSLGRIVSVRADTDSGVATLSEFSYDINIPLSAKTLQYTGPKTSGATADVMETRVFKDGVGREIHTISSGNNAAGQKYIKSGKTTYDVLGRVTRQSQPRWAADDEIDVFRPHVSEKHPTVTAYDASGRVLSVTSPRADASEGVTRVTTSYNDPWQITVTHSIGQGKTTTKNARGLLLKVEDFGSAALTTGGSSLSAKMEFCYDIVGNRIKRQDTPSTGSGTVSCPSPSSPGSIPTTADNSGNNISHWSYDAFGQLKRHNDPDTGLMSMNYNAFGDVESKTDSLSRTTVYSYDRLGRVVQKVRPGTEGIVSYIYDSFSGASNAIGKLVVLEDAAQRKRFSYDTLGRRKQEIRELKTPGTGALEAAFTTTFRYDLLDRTFEIDYPINPDDGTGQRVCYEYNAMGLPSSVKVNWAASTGSATEGCGSGSSKDIISSITYNEFRQQAEVTRGNGVITRYTYDNKRRVSRLTYVATDGTTTTTLVDTDYEYNVQNSITQVTATPTQEATDANFLDYQSTLNYTYDGLNRLVTANGETVEAYCAAPPCGSHTARKFERAYGYALNGNLTRKDFIDFDSKSLTDQWTFSYNNHKATSISSTAHGGQRISISYDSAGNTTQKADFSKNLTKTIQYDSDNRMTAVINQATSEAMGQYTYDDQGFRVRKVSRQIVDGQTRIYQLEYHNKYFAIEKQQDTTTGTILPDTKYTVNNIYLNGVRVAATVAGGAARYFLTDQVDSVHVVTNDSGQAISRMEYLPYGEVWFEEKAIDPNTNLPVTENHAPKYNSQELDKESGLYFFNARHYDPEIARFVTADTVIDGETSVFGWNRYMYVHGNPVMMKDPTGHFNIKFPGRSEAGHENLTKLALKASNILNERNLTEKERGRVQQAAVNGVRSNDITEGPITGTTADLTLRVFDMKNKHYGDEKQATHFMKRNKGQSNQEAINEGVNAISAYAAKAREYAAKGNTEAEFYFLGKAMHAIQDSFAPKHTKRNPVTGEIKEVFAYKGQEGHDANADAIYEEGPKVKSGTLTLEAGMATNASTDFLKTYEQARREGKKIDLSNFKKVYFRQAK